VVIASATYNFPHLLVVHIWLLNVAMNPLPIAGYRAGGPVDLASGGRALCAE
jgi:hypothetical protein